MGPFDTAAYEARVDPEDTILSLAERLAKYRGGGADCSLPLEHRFFDDCVVIRAEHAGILDFWQDPVLGDPEFYQVRVKPPVEKLDALVPLVKPGMSDEDVARVAAGPLQGWANTRYTVDALRRQRLVERLSQ